MNQLQVLLDQLRDKEAEAAINASESDPRTRAGVEAIVRNAVSDIPKIKEQYRQAVLQNVVLMAISGPYGEEFAKLAQKFKTPILDFTKISKDLSDRLKKRLVGEYYTSNAHFLFLDELAKLRIEYGIARLPTPLINQAIDGIYDAPVDQAVAKLIDKNYGGSLYSVVTRRDIGDIALNDKFAGQHLPIMVYNYYGNVDKQFLPEPVSVYNADSPADEKAVKKYLNEIRKLVIKKNDEENIETN